MSSSIEEDIEAIESSSTSSLASLLHHHHHHNHNNSSNNNNNNNNNNNINNNSNNHQQSHQQQQHHQHQQRQHHHHQQQQQHHQQQQQRHSESQLDMVFQSLKSQLVQAVNQIIDDTFSQYLYKIGSTGHHHHLHGTSSPTPSSLATSSPAPILDVLDEDVSLSSFPDEAIPLIVNSKRRKLFLSDHHNHQHTTTTTNNNNNNNNNNSSQQQLSQQHPFQQLQQQSQPTNQLQQTPQQQQHNQQKHQQQQQQQQQHYQHHHHHQQPQQLFHQQLLQQQRQAAATAALCNPLHFQQLISKSAAAVVASHNGSPNQQQQQYQQQQQQQQQSQQQQSQQQQQQPTYQPINMQNCLNDISDLVEITAQLSQGHLKKAKLMFFYVRYPNSSTLKEYFRDVKFNKNNTAQLVKWFSNFREFYYIQMEKFARDFVLEGITCAEQITVDHNSELLKIFNNHYNKHGHIEVPEVFISVVEHTLRQFFDAIYHRRDQEQSWKKTIYKIIARLDEPVPEVFKFPSFTRQLE